MRRASCFGMPIFTFIGRSRHGYPIFLRFLGIKYEVDKVRRGYTSHTVWKPVDIGKANQNRGYECRKWGAPHLPSPPSTVCNLEIEQQL